MCPKLLNDLQDIIKKTTELKNFKNLFAKQISIPKAHDPATTASQTCLSSLVAVHQ
jgi:hypothetical protein